MSNPSEKSQAESGSTTRKKILGSVKWTFLGSVLPQVIHPIITITLARLLSPTDYGVFGVAALVINLLNGMQGFGMMQALIRQRDEDVEDAANATFWVGLSTGIFVYIVCFFCAPLIADFFKEPRAVLLIRVQALSVIALGIVPVQIALLQRKYHYHKLFFNSVLPSLAPFAVAIPLAMNGYAYWALSLNVVASSVISAITLWVASPWRPKLKFPWAVAKPMVIFGSAVTGEVMLKWILANVDSGFTGKWFGISELGVYNLSKSISAIVIMTIIATIGPMAYNHLCEIHQDKSSFQFNYLRLTRISMTILFPVSLGVVAIAPTLFPIAFGSKWDGGIIPMQLLMIGELFWNLFWYNTEAFRAVGKPKYTIYVRMFLLVGLFPVFFFTSKYGFATYCISRAVVSVLIIPVSLYYSQTVFHVSAWRILSNTIKPLLFAATMCGVVLYVHFLGQQALSNYSLLPIEILTGAIVYSSLMWLFSRELFREVLGFALGALKSR